MTEVAAIYLARRGMKLAELADLRQGVEVAVTDLAAARIDDEGTAGLYQALAREVDANEDERAGTVRDLHIAVAAAARNRVLQLVALVLIRLSRLPLVERAPGRRGRCRPRCSAPTRTSHVQSRTATESWLATACADTSTHSGPLMVTGRNRRPLAGNH